MPYRVARSPLPPRSDAGKQMPRPRARTRVQAPTRSRCHAVDSRLKILRKAATLAPDRQESNRMTSLHDLRRELTAVPESPLVQIATLAESMPGSIKLCYGESDLPTPAFITEAAHRAALDGHTFYTHTAGYAELRQAIVTKARDLHGVAYDETEVMATVGASMAIFAAIRAYIGPGDNAVIISP